MSDFFKLFRGNKGFKDFKVLKVIKVIKDLRVSKGWGQPAAAICLAMLVAGALAFAAEGGSPLRRGTPAEAAADTSPKIALAYVEDFRKTLPDPDFFTHLVYAFADFNDRNDGVVVARPEKLRAMVALKEQNPDLKVILGIGGYKKEGFSEMASSRKKRKAFVRQVKGIIKDYSLDGVDLDWEFPTTTDGGHTARPDDDRNYALLARDLRKALGPDKWISYYSNNSGRFIDHRAMLPWVSYVNVSGYNLAVPNEKDRVSRHQSPLYPSAKTGEWCVAEVVAKHIALGIPPEKILVGIPFFGRGKAPFPSYTECGQFEKNSSGTSLQWDETAQAPYYADTGGRLLMGFDDERSIEAKMDFVRANALPGIFVWNYDSDFPDHRLAKTIERLRK